MNQSSTYTVTVNGDAIQVEYGARLTDVVRATGLNPDAVRGVALALNDEVVRREAWADTRVAPGDRIEIVTAQQGG
jgi:sulfur carrier protein